MADVIRKAVVQIALEQIPAELKAPSIEPLEESARRQLDISSQVRDRISEGAQQTSEEIRKTSITAKTSIDGLRDSTAATTVAQRALGSATAAAGTAAAGAATGFSALAASVLPVTIAVTALVVVLEKARDTYSYFADRAEAEAERAKKAAERFYNYIDARNQAFGDYQSTRLDNTTDALARQLELETQISQVRTAQTFNNNTQSGFTSVGLNAGNSPDFRRTEVVAVQLQEERLRLLQSQTDNEAKINQEKLRGLDVRERELDRTKQLLAAEESRVQSIKAQVGALGQIEQDELKRLAARAGAGDRLNTGELSRLQQLGGDIARPFVQDQFAERGAGLAAEVAKLLGGSLGGGDAARIRADGGLAEGQSVGKAMQELAASRRDLLAEVRSNNEEARLLIESTSKVLKNLRERLALTEYKQNESEAAQ